MKALPFQDRAADRRVLTLLLVGLVVLFGGLYFAAYAFAGDKVPRGTTVEGVAVGGLEPAAARAKLRRELEPRASQPLVVAAAGRRTSVPPEKAGVAVDHEESIAQAGGGRSLHPGRIWNFFTGGGDLDAVVTIDGEKLSSALAPFVDKVERRPVDGDVRFTRNGPEPRKPREGRKVVDDSIAKRVADAYLSDDVARLEVETTPAEVSAEAVAKAMDTFANPAMSAPVTLVLDGEEVVLQPEAYAKALSMEAKDGKLVPKVHQKRLMAAVRPAMGQVALRPRPATVRLVNGRPKVIPGKNGVTFDPGEVTKAFPDLLVGEGQGRRMKVRTVVDKPAFTTKDARGLGIKEVVSSFTTEFPHANYRNVNLGRAAELVNGTVLKPGETFSLNDTVGERTEENGFTKGYIISDGVYKEELGGGVSQVATTLFNAAFFAGLEDVEHKPHSFYIDRYPLGREATVVWGALDLRFKNDTPHGVLIQSWIERSTPSSTGRMHVRFWSTKYWNITAGVSDRYDFTKEKTRYVRGPKCEPHDGYAGFDVDVFRYFRRAGNDELVRKEKMHTTYAPSDSVVCGRKPKNGG